MDHPLLFLEFNLLVAYHILQIFSAKKTVFMVFDNILVVTKVDFVHLVFNPELSVMEISLEIFIATPVLCEKYILMKVYRI